MFRAERMVGRRFLLQRIERLVNLGERFAVLNCLFKSVSSSVPLELNPFELKMPERTPTEKFYDHYERYQSAKRNRALSIVKSRGMKNSNQVRELILSDQDRCLHGCRRRADGSARWQKDPSAVEPVFSLQFR
jgi:hypothetical protein